MEGSSLGRPTSARSGRGSRGQWHHNHSGPSHLPCSPILCLCFLYSNSQREGAGRPTPCLCSPRSPEVCAQTLTARFVRLACPCYND